ncbi:hypothetical protein HUG17_5818 [Dermatophagoides farinae]|uniref:Uncharacterized protein n=1 Tax=Dermatophagoides farinae TaxID=6954 RepID=A0A9D4SIJ7_DERFA|nr:hypothetical protein HUG17_5818 [Dermatophagoides farinae]
MAFRGQTSARVQSRRFQHNQSQPDASPVSDHSPNGPSFRANPYPEKLEAVNLGDLLRILVRLSTKVNLAFGFSRTDNSAPDSARTAELFSFNIHISRQAVFMDSKLYREKTTLPRTAADVSKFDSVTALVPESTSFLSQSAPMTAPGRPTSDTFNAIIAALLLVMTSYFQNIATTVEYRLHATASSIFRASCFGRSDDRFARQNRYRPPPEFPLASSCPGIVHHLSGTIVYAPASPDCQ